MPALWGFVNSLPQQIKFCVFDVDKAGADSEPNEMRIVLGADFAFDGVVMIANSLQAEVEKVCDCFARQPGGQQAKDLGLTRAQMLDNLLRFRETVGGNGASILGKVSPFRHRSGFDACRKGSCCPQVLPELVVEVTRHGPALFFLNLEQACGKRRASRVRAGQFFREVIDGAGDEIEFGGAEPRQTSAEAALLQFAQSLNDRVCGDQSVPNHQCREHGYACCQGRRDADDD